MRITFLAFLLAAFSFSFGSNIEVHSRLASDNLFSSEIGLHLRIYNTSVSKLDLSKENLTYRFSDNAALSQFAYDIWWNSTGNASDAKIVFSESTPGEKSFNLSFLKGEVAAGSYAEIQLRIYKKDWSFFSMIGDYSLPLSGTQWAANPNIAINSNGSAPDFPIFPPEQNTNAPVELADMLLNLSDYSIFASNEAKLADRVPEHSGIVEIYGSVGSDNYAESGADSKITGNLHANKNAFLRERAQVFGDLRVGENYTMQNFVSVIGEKTANKPIPDFQLPSKNDLRIGTSDIYIGNHDTLRLEPGNYRDLTANANSVLFLKPGKYAFRNFKLEPEVKLNLDVSEGVLEINASETITFSDRSVIEYKNNYTNPVAFRVYQHGNNDLRIGTDLSIAGYFVAPNATVRINSRVKFAGWVHAKNVSVEPDTKICEPPMLVGLTHSKIAYAPEFSALTPEYYTALNAADLEIFTRAKNKNTSVSISKSGSTYKIKLHDQEKANITPLCAVTEYSLTALNSQKPIIHVKENSSCAENSCTGASWGSAFKTLRKGLTAAKTQGKTIWLAEGNYTISDSLFRIGMGTEIRGGFRGEDNENFETRVGDINKTVIKGTGSNSLLFLGGSGLPYADYLDYATVTKANIVSVGAAPILDYLIIKDNDIKANGGAVYSLFSDSVKVLNSYIVGNKAVLGGALFAEKSSLGIENTVIAANAADNGAAIYAENSRLRIRHATIADNSAQAGKGIAFANSNAESINNIVWNNGGSDLATTAQNPLFKESVAKNFAAGEDSVFYTKDDGYALSDSSALIDIGVKQADIPVDIFQLDRTISKDESGLPDMGAREWFPDLNRNFNFLKKTATKGLQPVEKPTIIEENVDDYFPLKLKNTPYAYVFSAKLPKNKYMKDSHSGTVRILTNDKKKCGEAKDVRFYRIGEENGMVEYRTYRKRGEGVYLFLSQKEMPSYDWYHVLKVCPGGYHVQIKANK